MNYSTQAYRDKLFDDLSVRRRDLVILMCAIVIASVGLNLNSPATVIGAMLISPLMSPIVGIGLGLTLYDVKLLKKSVRLLLVEVVISLAVSVIYFYLSPITYSSPELLARTAPTIWDVIVALAGGLAGVIGSRQREATNIVPGVAIATALMPPLCTVSFCLVNGHLTLAMGAAQLFLINTVFITLATLVGSQFLRQQQQDWAFDRLSLRLRLGILGAIAVLLVPSLFAAGRLVQEHLRTEGMTQFVATELADQVVIKQQYRKRSKQLELTVTGQPLSDGAIEQLKKRRAAYGLEAVELVIHQVPSGEAISREELYQYIEQRLAEAKQTQRLQEEDE